MREAYENNMAVKCIVTVWESTLQITNTYSKILIPGAAMQGVMQVDYRHHSPEAAMAVPMKKQQLRFQNLYLMECSRITLNVMKSSPWANCIRTKC